MNVLDLFSGIGGFSLGLERAGMRTVAFCEIEPFCRRVLKKHWPEVPIYDDIRELTAERLAGDGISVDLICGGFPCQDISVAGKGAGIDGARSGLWKEYARLIGEIRPRYVIVENVAALLGRGLSRVLGDLAEIGYDAEWHIISAADVGAPHRRERVWIVAYPGRDGGESDGGFGQLADSAGAGQGDEEKRERVRDAAGGRREDVADPGHAKPSGRIQVAEGQQFSGGRQTWGEFASCCVMADTICKRQPGSWESFNASHTAPLIQGKANHAFNERIGGIWATEPNVGRVANGVPSRVDRLRGLGNAVVPQIPELIGRAIMDAESKVRGV